ncbi:MAG: hypothetical protein RJA36_1217 [Pseudomonadota bacterium]
MKRLTPPEVLELARQQGERATCASCSPYASPGWESFPSTESEQTLQPVGALWLPGDDEPTLEEHRAPGVDQWSPQASIALAFHPCNRCEVWACRHCGKPFLRYTEYGGYYEDRRIRELDPRLVVAGEADPAQP